MPPLGGTGDIVKRVTIERPPQADDPDEGADEDEARARRQPARHACPSQQCAAELLSSDRMGNDQPR
jgi:hypothetical protein